MKIRLLREAESASGPLPAGTEIDDPLAWIHCLPGWMNADPLAIAIDEECQNKVQSELAKRPEQLQALKRLLKHPPAGLPADLLQNLARAYALELDTLPPVSA